MAQDIERQPQVAGGPTLVLFAVTTFLSAILLFSVQPMFAKMALPVLGGSPSVWAVALCFFQAALLAGYCYAHLLIRHVSGAVTGYVHLAVCLTAFLALPIALPSWSNDPPAGDAYLWQLGLFSVAIGAPFVAVSANAPLLQAWFARTGHPDGKDPYFLYAASNLGSLISLLGYPLVLEPAFGLKALSFAWSVGFACLLAFLAVCFWEVRRRCQKAAQIPSERVEQAELVSSVSWRDRMTWLWLSMIPAALLTAFTTHVATDVASAPLIWVIPLSLYLLTFVLVFRDKALIPPRALHSLHVAAVLMALLQLSQIKHESIYLSAPIGVLAFLSSALVAHRTLYEARPSASHLTEFYLFMSLGGALGGIFASLLAPQLFSEVLEYPLILALSFACRPGVLRVGSGNVREPAILGVILLVIAAVLYATSSETAKHALDFDGWGIAPLFVAGLAALVVIMWRFPIRQLAGVLAIFLILAFMPSATHRGAAERSYFGVYRVVVSEDGDFHVLQHGTTLHGAQRIRDENGNAVKDIFPVTYYHPRSPMAMSVALTRRTLGPQVKGRFGVIGLGAGALACHSMEGEFWRFYEIDPIVVKIAQSEKFTFMSTCQPNADIVVGDARLTVAKEPSESFDLLIVDAFSSDAVPMHLLTVEALKLYLSKLKPHGVVALHISNRYLDLEAVLHATLAEAGIKSSFVIVDPTPDDGYAVTRSTVVVFGNDPRVTHQFLRVRGAQTLSVSTLRPWTDDSSEILGPFLSRLKNVR